MFNSIRDFFVALATTVNFAGTVTFKNVMNLRFLWSIKSHITCNSTNVIYFLKCNSCKVTTYTGKTNNLRKRMNGHKSSCALGNSTDIFDNHVYKCRKERQSDIRPMFLVYFFLTVKDTKLLLAYEHFLHEQRHDTLN